MSTVPMPRRVVGNGYPTTDHKPMAETDLHRRLMHALIETLEAFYREEPLTYVSGNLLLFYEEQNKKKHVSPDVFVVWGVGKRERENYLLWEEPAPRFVIELTSSSTRRTDIGKKKDLYRDVLKVREYFLFDPNGDYLKPPMQGWRLRGGVYRAIQPIDGRLPSETTGLHLERDGKTLRLWNPETNTWLPTPMERIEDAVQHATAETQARREAEQHATAETQARREAEVENMRLRRLLEESGIRVDEPE